MEAKNKILFVMILTVVTMIAEIYFGFITNSMALLADGCHMGTHALAFLLTYLAYYFCTKFTDCPNFKSGTDKIKELAGYTSSMFLGLSGILIIYESVVRIFHPLNINLNEAMTVVIIGLVINVISVLIMDFDDIHNHLHKHPHTHKNRDNNFKSAYFHILADLLTSIFAIIALVCAKFMGLIILDPIMGVISGVIIIRWAIDLIKSTARNLLDIE